MDGGALHRALDRAAESGAEEVLWRFIAAGGKPEREIRSVERAAAEGWSRMRKWGTAGVEMAVEGRRVHLDLGGNPGISAEVVILGRMRFRVSLPVQLRSQRGVRILYEAAAVWLRGLAEAATVGDRRSAA